MTPLDKAREALAAVEKATAGEWYQPDGANGHIWNNDAEPGEGYTPDRVIFEGPIQPQWAKDRKPDEWYGENERNLTAAAAAVNFVRNDLPAVIAEHERLADRVAKLEAFVERVSNGKAFDAARWADDDDAEYHMRRERLVMQAARALLTPDNGADDGR